MTITGGGALSKARANTTMLIMTMAIMVLPNGVFKVESSNQLFIPGSISIRHLA